MSWAGERRFTYALATILVFFLVIGGVYFALTYAPANCFDTEQNGDELGVDCGGKCERLCPFEVADLKVLWSRSFEVSPGKYNAVAYIENPNRYAGIRDVGYRFRVMGSAGEVLAEREGRTYITPNGVSPIFESNITTGGAIPTRTFFEFTEDLKWTRGVSVGQSLVVKDTRLLDTATRPRIDASIVNTTLNEFKDVEVVGIVFAADGNAIAASRTVVDLIEKSSTEPIVFTWPRPYEKRLERCSIPSDVALVLDMSGSMNDDGGTPPQPIADATSAAASFVTRLMENDRVALTTFSDVGRLLLELSLAHGRAQNEIDALTIRPEDEVGRKTNITGGLEVAEEALLAKPREEDHSKVIVLLTDGRANVPTESEGEAAAIRIAERAKSEGIELYFIGLGTDVNHTFLETVATAPQYYFRSGSSKELESIYRQISTSICERGPAVIQVIPRPREGLQTP